MRKLKLFAKSGNAKNRQTNTLTHEKMYFINNRWQFFVLCLVCVCVCVQCALCAPVSKICMNVYCVVGCTVSHAWTLNMRLTCCCVTKVKQNLARWRKKTPHRFAQNLYSDNVYVHLSSQRYCTALITFNSSYTRRAWCCYCLHFIIYIRMHFSYYLFWNVHHLEMFVSINEFEAYTNITERTKSMKIRKKERKRKQALPNICQIKWKRHHSQIIYS